MSVEIREDGIYQNDIKVADIVWRTHGVDRALICKESVDGPDDLQERISTLEEFLENSESESENLSERIEDARTHLEKAFEALE